MPALEVDKKMGEDSILLKSTTSGGEQQQQQQIKELDEKVSRGKGGRFTCEMMQWVVCLFTSISGLLFGYDLCVMVIALSFIGKDLNLSTIQQEALISTPMFGAIPGAIIAGYACDRFGRKRTVSITGGLFFVGGILMAISPTFGFILMGRLLVGLAIGASGPSVSIYISELGPAETRGRLVTINELMVCVGCLTSIVVNNSLEMEEVCTLTRQEDTL